MTLIRSILGVWQMRTCDASSAAQRAPSVRVALVVAVAFLVIARNAWCGEDDMMTGSQLQACSVALVRFKSDQAHAEIANFRVVVHDHPTEFEVVFIPNQPRATVPQLEGRTVVLGGETEYGREVHYFISKDTFEISRQHFAR